MVPQLTKETNFINYFINNKLLNITVTNCVLKNWIPCQKKPNSSSTLLFPFWQVRLCCFNNKFGKSTEDKENSPSPLNRTQISLQIKGKTLLLGESKMTQQSPDDRLVTRLNPFLFEILGALLAVYVTMVTQNAGRSERTHLKSELHVLICISFGLTLSFALQ